MSLCAVCFLVSEGRMPTNDTGSYRKKKKKCVSKIRRLHLRNPITGNVADIANDF